MDLVTQSLARDMERSIRILDRDGLDGIQQDIGRIIRMSVETTGRNAADLIGPLLQEGRIVFIIHVDVRAGEVHADRSTAGRLGECI